MRRRLVGRDTGLGQDLAGKRITLVGDVLHSRVARSNVDLLHTLGAEVTLVAPPTLVPVGVETWPCEVSYDLDAVLPKSDAVMMLRVQRERMNAAFFPTEREYSRRYGLDGERMAKMPEHAIVMHPGPMVRGMEITAEVADSDRCTVVEQVANGVSVRMAVLYLLLGGSEPAVTTTPPRAPRRPSDHEQDPDPRGEGTGRRAAGRPDRRRDRRGGRHRPLRRGRDRDRGRRAGPPAGSGRPPHPPARARPRGLRDRPHRHPRRRRRRLHLRLRHGQHHPVADTAGVVEQIYRLGQEHGYCDVQPIGAVTVGLEGKKLAELGAMHDSAAGVTVFSDDGKCVDDAVIMRRALEYVKAFGGVVAQHAQEPRLTEGAQMNEGVVSAELGLGGWPAVAEESIIARDVLLAEHVGSRVHICHSLHRRLRRDRPLGQVPRHRRHRRGHPAPPPPHGRAGPLVQPGLQGQPAAAHREGRLALREALADGTIDIVATDHAPHPHEDKDCEWAAAAMGMVGLETALRRPADDGRDRTLDWAGVADRMSFAPARIGRAKGHGRPVSAGEPANLTLVDPAYRGVVDPADFASRSRNTPTRAASCRDASPTPSAGPGNGRGREAGVTPLIAIAAEAAEQKSAEVTDWAGRIGWVAGLLLFVAFVYWLMRQGWKWRGSLQSDLPALPTAPETAGAAKLTLSGRYHGSTTAGQWLDRIVAHGLGTRSRVELTLTDAGSRSSAPGRTTSSSRPTPCARRASTRASPARSSPRAGS